MKAILKRYVHCGPQIFLTNNSQILVDSVSTFINNGNYEKGQISELHSFLDLICQTGKIKSSDSTNTNLTQLATAGGTCQAIEDIFDKLYPNFLTSATNKTSLKLIETVDRHNMRGMISSMIKSNLAEERLCQTTSLLMNNLENKLIQTRRLNQPMLESSSLTRLILESVVDRLMAYKTNWKWDLINKLEHSSGINSPLKN